MITASEKTDKDYVKKVFPLKALDVDDKTRRVKVAIAELESIDRDNDVFDPGAFDKTLRENGPKGSNEIWHLLDHSPRSFSALGKFSEISREGKYIAGVSNYKSSMFAWREVAWPLYEAGDINQHSVGFQPLQVEEGKSGDEPRIIKEVRLFEGSAVLWGANPNTPTLEIMKRLFSDDDERDITGPEKIDEIVKKLKTERRGFSPEDYSLLVIELQRLKKFFEFNKVAEIFREPSTENTPGKDDKSTFDNNTFTEPVPGITRPEFIECPHCLKFTKSGDKDYVRCHRCNYVFIPGSSLHLTI